MDTEKEISTSVTDKSVKREKGKRGKRENKMTDKLIYNVIGCMIEVHKELGPGFFRKAFIVVRLQLNSRTEGFYLNRKRK
jgi:hypothetical protein